MPIRRPRVPLPHLVSILLLALATLAGLLVNSMPSGRFLKVTPVAGGGHDVHGPGLAAPTGVAASPAPGSGVSLVWNAKDEGHAATYEHRRSLDGGPSQSTPASVPAPATSSNSVAIPRSDPRKPRLLPSWVDGFLAKVAADTAQVRAFYDGLDDDLGSVVPATYYWDRLVRAADYALGFRGRQAADPTTATRYAHKAIGLARSAIRDSHRDGSGPWQFLAQGDGGTTDFALPGTSIVPGSLTVYSVPLTATAITKGAAGGKDDLGRHASVFRISKIVKLVSTNSVAASPAWAAGADWAQVAFKDPSTLSEEVIDWSPGGSEPSPGATYYAVSAPIGNGANLVGPSSYSVAGNDLHFKVAPAPDRAIFVACLFDDGTLEYQQTGNGLGGRDVWPTTDNLYPLRYLGPAVATVLDWCQGAPGFDRAARDELADELVILSDLSKSTTYAPAEWGGESNYAVGNLLMRCWAALVLQGRHAEADRLKAEVVPLYKDAISPKFGTPSATTSSLKGGFPGEGLSSYGLECYKHLFLAVAGLADSGWDFSPVSPGDEIAQFAGEAIRFNLFATYSFSANTQIPGQTRAGSAYEGGDNAYDPCPSVDKAMYAMASGLSSDASASAYARYLINTKPGDLAYNAWDLLFRDATGTATDWAAEIGTSYVAPGRGIGIARSGWGANAPWVCFADGNRGNGDHDEPGAGDLTVYRGADRLLISAAALGKRYNNDPAGPWTNIVTVDDDGARKQTFRWSSTPIFGDYQGIDRPGVGLTAIDEQPTYTLFSGDYRAIYAKNSAGLNPCDVLDTDVMFIPTGADSAYVVQYTRCTTTDANYPKHLRTHTGATAHPVGTGTITLSRTGGGTGSAIAWNATAAQVKAQVDALYSLPTTVEKRADGYWIVKFPAGTHAALTGTASAPGAIVEIYDFHPEGAPGARTIQHVVLASTIGGTQRVDAGSSRMFLRVDSSDTLVQTAAKIGAGQFSPGSPCRRLSARPASAVAATRFGRLMQVGPNSVRSMDASAFVTGANSKLQGYRIGSHVAMFRMGAGFSPPETYSLTASGTLNHHAVGLPPGTTYTLTGATETEATVNGAGVLNFTTTATNPTVAINTHAPRRVPTLAFSWVDPGMDADLVSWQAENSARIADARYWLWQVILADYGDTGRECIVVGHHDAPPLGAGIRVYRDSGSSLTGFTNVTASEFAANDWGLGSAGGNLLALDINGDGTPDLIGTTGAAANDNQPGSYLIGGHFVLRGTGVNLAGASTNYLANIGDHDGDGDVDAYADPGTRPADGITAFSRLTRVLKTWNGAAYVESTVARPIPKGLSGTPIEADWRAAINQRQPDNCKTRFFRFDIDGDGNKDLVIFVFFAYASQLDRIWWLKSDGAGGWIDNGAAWGLPSTGVFMPLIPAHLQSPQIHYFDRHLHTSIDGTGALHLFVAGGSAPGMYRWDSGTGRFAKASHAADGLQKALEDTDYAGGATDDYLAQLLAGDWTNSGNIDLVYDTPRNGGSWIFQNDGAGRFTQYLGPTYPNDRFRHWSPQGITVGDLDNDGLPDFVIGGTDGTNAGGGTVGTAARVIRILKNTTANPGRYLKVKIRRASGPNRFGVGAVIEVYQAGTSTLLRRWPADYFGRPTRFGCGSRTAVDVKVTYPGGSAVTHSNVATDQTVTYSD